MKLVINGETVEPAAAPGQSLRTFLRDREHFEVKKGCDSGDCGACSILLDGVPVHSCIYPAARAEGKAVTTVAGLGLPDDLAPLQQRFIDAGGFQCGFCTPGMIVTASTLADGELDALPRMLSGNLCRCTGYRAIEDAIRGTHRPVGESRPAEPLTSGNDASRSCGRVGTSLPAPASARVVSGQEPYTLDVAVPGLLHLAIVASPHAHARIRSIDTSAAAALPGVHAVLTHGDAPATLYSTARHENRLDDPDDTRVLDDVVRFRGQRVAAVVADTVAIAEHACRLIVVDYLELPAVYDPRAALLPGAPTVHGDKNAVDARLADPSRNLVAEMHGEHGELAAGLAAATTVVTGTWQTQRVAHNQIETHGTIGWIEDGRLVLRTATQVPFLVHKEICRVFGLEPAKVRVFAARVGGGFGGKQEILTEDIVTLAVLATGRPVQYEFTRTDELTISPVRHPFQVTVTLGATDDGRLTALGLDVLSDTGAYGNHGPGVMYHGCSESVSLYAVPNKRVDAACVYTNNPPSGAFRGYGLGQVIFGIESALDELAHTLGMSPFALRRLNSIGPTDPLVVTEAEGDDLIIGSYGLDQCLDLAEAALDHSLTGPAGWPVGTGMALAMIATIAPRGHFATATVSVLDDGAGVVTRALFEIAVGTAEFGNGTTTVHTQLVATALGTTVDRIRIRQSDTDATSYDTGAFGSAGVVVAGKALLAAAEQLRDMIAAQGLTVGLNATAEHDGTPRSVSFNVHAFRVAVNTATGEVQILQSIQSADAGVVLNPEQLRGQIEGGTAQAIGTALFEEVLLDGEGRVTTTALRNYHIPRFVDLPVTEVLFADTHDPLGPLGAKSMSEAPYNPVAPALANAIRDAMGVRSFELPMSRDRLWRLASTRQS
ncbi:MAG: molybdopterin-dependent oxidoreductase [Cellulomonas sp.]|nr:molybdopterin-dependent oxidoreductase [Cellulomonas sp.]